MALETNLVASYLLRDLTDNFGSNNLTNNGSVTFDQGLSGFYCADANFGSANSSKYLSIASSLGLNGLNQPISIAIWVKMLAEISSSYQVLTELMDSSVHHVMHQIYYDYNAGTRRIVFNRQTVGNANNIVSYNIALGTTNPHLVVYTYDGSTLQGYVDANASGTLATSGDGPTTVSDFYRIGFGDANYLSGIEFYAFLWSRALSSSEVTQLYNSGNGLYYNGSKFVDPTPDGEEYRGQNYPALAQRGFFRQEVRAF